MIRAHGVEGLTVVYHVHSAMADAYGACVRATNTPTLEDIRCPACALAAVPDYAVVH
jgi:hypothetical protein